MKIGFSFARCVSDILNEKVAYDDVFLIIARTAIFDSSAIRPVVESYWYDGRIASETAGVWAIEDAIKIGERLYRDAKMFQPRTMGKSVPTVMDGEHWMDLAPTVEYEDENVKKAWNQYQMMLRLTVENQPKVPSHLPKLDDNF